MTSQRYYQIGTPGTPWGAEEKAAWLSSQTAKRSYQQQVVSSIEKIRWQMSELVIVEQYGALSYAPGTYTLFAIKTKNWQGSKATILVTGGVHGYETSGVHGALRFVESELASYADTYNFIVAPCISPWGYETINRWNPNTVDPNRSFYSGSPAEEAINVMNYIDGLNIAILAHIDLHETTDSDNSEFRPALAARDAIAQKAWDIPDGFYAVGDTVKPEPEFQKAIIDSVEKVTHIAPTDENNKLIGVDVEQRGVINYATKELGLCAGFTDAPFVTTTEVYPDSQKVNDENCIAAQVAAVTGALNYLKASDSIAAL
ncbi:MAG: M14 family metallopeptidase [Pseudomonadales bacterium]